MLGNGWTMWGERLFWKENAEKKLTATELMKKLENDKDYQEKKKQKDFALKQKHELLVKEYKSFSKECKKLGYSLETAWDLVMVKQPYPDLIPILMKYLEEKNHSSKFREGIARALAVYDSSPYFDRLFELYKESKNECKNVSWAIACTLSASALTQEQFDIIEKMIYNKEIGNDRNALLNAIKRMKGEQKKRCLAYARQDEALRINLGDSKLDKERGEKN